MQAVLFGFYTDGSWGGAEVQLASRTSRIQGMNLVTRAYTPGKNGLHRLLPQDTMPARVQAPSFWQTRGPPESPCRRRQDCPSQKEGARLQCAWTWPSPGGADQGHLDLLKGQLLLCPQLLGGLGQGLVLSASRHLKNSLQCPLCEHGVKLNTPGSLTPHLVRASSHQRPLIALLHAFTGTLGRA